MTAIKDIMTIKPICLSHHANIHKARMLMAEKSIRHIPIKNNTNGDLVGILSQKRVLANAIRIINERGMENLEHEEKSIEIDSVIDKEPLVADINDPLVEVAKTLSSKKGGAIAIKENSRLVGIVTSSDFVKYAIQELEEDS